MRVRYVLFICRHEPEPGIETKRNEERALEGSGEWSRRQNTRSYDREHASLNENCMAQVIHNSNRCIHS